MKRRLKNWVKKVLKGIPFAWSRNQRYDAQTLQVMRKVLKSDSVCIDVGGHEGEILSEMIRLSPQGDWYCFEPIPELAQKVKAQFPQAKVMELALSDRAGTATFQHVVSNPAYSGLRKRQYKGKEQIEEITVKTARLDDVVSPEVPVALIKIDVEGGEWGVLAGASSLIRTQKPVIVFEHGKGASDFYGTSPDQIHGFFTENGMRISLMENWLNNGPSLSAEEFRRQYEKEINYYFIAHP